MLTMLFNKSHDPIYFHTAEASGTLENDRIKPKLGNFVFTPHMDVWRFAPI